MQDVLRKEVETIYDMTSVMNPQSREEFIAVALPNLHTRVFELLSIKNNEVVKKAIELAEKWIESTENDISFLSENDNEECGRIASVNGKNGLIKELQELKKTI